MPEKSKAPVPLHEGQTASEAAAAILKHHFEYLLEWEESAKNWDDIEGVHQVRVSFRKMRSAFSLFRDAIPKAASKLWNEEIRWIAGEMGLARDLDVFIDEGLGTIRGKLPYSGEQKLVALAMEARARTYQEQVRPMLESERYAIFKSGFEPWYQARAWENAELNKKQHANLQMKLGKYSRKVLDKQERRVLALGSNIDRSDAQEMHRLRIECKKLRYAADFFKPLYSGVGDFIAHMKGLQDILGVMNDISVMHKLLSTILADTNDHEALEYAGAIVGWRTCEFYHQLDNFDRYWDEFTEATHPWWKKNAG
ncbi:MAG: CHAD domain-containing protein [Gammaproteobacteria bacterium]|nr:CHAD domain-containing protein [Gammaproteobacteria bacterium]MCB1880340.1 CHAD domain-containing protein [Gammaproteobacteria bacterium]